MSRLEELIYTLCPNGAEYKPLGSVVKILTAPQKLNRSQYRDIGQYAIVDQGQTLVIGFTDNAKAILPKNKYVVFGDHTRIVKYIDFPFAQGADGLKILLPKDNLLDSKYLYYAFTNLQVPSRGYNRHWSIAQDFLIPIPPMPVQEEIVRILDAFSGVVAELEQKLDAEQAARVRQYEHYRNELLSFDSNSRIMEKLLAQICREEVKYKRLGGKEGICRVEPSGVDKVISSTERSVKLCNYMDVYNNKYITDAIVEQCSEGSVSQSEYERFVLREGQVLLTKDSETREDIAQSAYVCKDFDNVVCGYHLAVLSPVEKINSKYLNHVLQSANLRNYFSKMANGVSRYGLKLKSIEDAIIPLPPLEIQEQIVSILDRFDTLVNDLKSGLPAEIALRRKQYEYYRDKLLTFPQKPPL